MCGFCDENHEYEAACDKRDAAFARLHKDQQDLRKRRMTERREWPPKECTVRLWKADETGGHLDCAIARAHSLCGYVKVPSDHPYANKHYDKVAVSVHGGLTFQQRALDGGMWFGFDTNHVGDWMALEGIGEEIPGRIWTVDDVAAQVQQLAMQLTSLNPPKQHGPGAQFLKDREQ